jgi:hypothetical protein
LCGKANFGSSNRNGSNAAAAAAATDIMDSATPAADVRLFMPK